VVFCTFAGINFLAEGVPESRNLHLKFQFFSGVDTARPEPHCRRWLSEDHEIKICVQFSLVARPTILVREDRIRLRAMPYISNLAALRMHHPVKYLGLFLLILKCNKLHFWLCFTTFAHICSFQHAVVMAWLIIPWIVYLSL